MTENELRQSVVNIARGWLGRKESDGSHRAIIDLYNSHKPLARGYPVKYTDAWCSTFASAVAIKAGLTDIIPTECGCGKHIELFKKLGSWEENDAYVPKPADYIFYDWQDGANYATTDNRGGADHVGVVEKVVGQTITVIEVHPGLRRPQLRQEGDGWRLRPRCALHALHPCHPLRRDGPHRPEGGNPVWHRQEVRDDLPEDRPVQRHHQPEPHPGGPENQNPRRRSAGEGRGRGQQGDDQDRRCLRRPGYLQGSAGPGLHLRPESPVHRQEDRGPQGRLRSSA